MKANALRFREFPRMACFENRGATEHSRPFTFHFLPFTSPLALDASFPPSRAPTHDRPFPIRQCLLRPRCAAVEGRALVGGAVAALRAVVSGAISAEGHGAAGLRGKGGRRGGDPFAGEHHLSLASRDRRPRLDRRRGADPQPRPGRHRIPCLSLATRLSLHGIARFFEGVLRSHHPSDHDRRPLLDRGGGVCRARREPARGHALPRRRGGAVHAARSPMSLSA